MAVFIAPGAVVDPRAELDDEVYVGPFCVVGPKVRIGAGTRLENGVTLMGRVTLGRDNRLYPGVVVGADPQDLSYRGADTQVTIGDGNTLRESVTVNRASEKEDGVTSLGDNNYLMACVHVAHDCKLGSGIVIANSTLLGGHVHIGDHATLSGNIGVHQFASIGKFSFTAGLSVARRAAVYARRRQSGPAPLRELGRSQAPRLYERRRRCAFGSPSLALSLEGRLRACS